MPRWLAIEWDSSEARLAVAATRGRQWFIEDAFSVALRPRGAAGESGEVDIGTRIAAALGVRRISRVETLVAVGRASIELRQLSLPPAPDEELPELVRFQAMREFNELEDDWLLDFVPLDEGAADAPRTVLAAAIDSDLVAQIEQTCQRAGLKPSRLVLRAGAAASLYGRRAAAPGRLTLLVDLLGDEVDLTVMIDRRVVFLRTTRLAEDPLEQAQSASVLVGEMRRTMVAAQNQLGGRRVEAIALCGAGPRHVALAAALAEALAVPVETFDPFEGFELGSELRRGLPDNPGRFAPLVGMLADEAEGTGHAMDFLHPRRKPPPPSRRNRIVAGAAAATLVVLGVLLWTHLQRQWLSDEVESLRRELPKWEQAAARAVKARDTAGLVGNWTATDVVWLDELARLSERFPAAREAMLRELSFGPGPKGGQIELEGLARTAESIAVVESALADETHRVLGKGSSEDRTNPNYAWQFATTVLVDQPAAAPHLQGNPASTTGAAATRPGGAAATPREARP